MKVKIIKFKNYAGKLPKRAHHDDSGADVFAAEDVVIKAHSIYAVPLGIGTELPCGYDIVIHCKSGLSTKGIWASNAPVDAGYRGEIHAILYNTTDTDYKISKGEKVGQMVVRPVVYVDFVEDFEEDGRGSNGFGSTGNS